MPKVGRLAALGVERDFCLFEYGSMYPRLPTIRVEKVGTPTGRSIAP